MSLILDSISDHIAAVKSIEPLQPSIIAIADYLIDSLQSGGKILLMGNGGSAADAQHIAAEFVGRFNKKDRRALPAISLTTDPSIVTALANDFGASYIFSRQIEAFARNGDCVFGISTSGNSPNVIEGIRSARERGCRTFALLGNNGGSLKEMVDIPLVVASANTPRIQECHNLIGHLICDLVERGIAENDH